MRGVFKFNFRFSLTVNASDVPEPSRCYQLHFIAAAFAGRGGLYDFDDDRPYFKMIFLEQSLNDGDRIG